MQASKHVPERATAMEEAATRKTMAARGDTIAGTHERAPSNLDSCLKEGGETETGCPGLSWWVYVRKEVEGFAAGMRRVRADRGS